LICGKSVQFVSGTWHDGADGVCEDRIENATRRGDARGDREVRLGARWKCGRVAAWRRARTHRTRGGSAGDAQGRLSRGAPPS